MNILHLEASPGWGGQEMRILLEAEGMRTRGHDIVLGVMKGGRLIEEARKKGFIVYELNFKRIAWPICLLQLFYIMYKHGIDLVNTHSSLDSWIGGIAARLARKTIIRTRHLSTPVRAGLNSRIVYGALADFVITTCSAIMTPISRQSGKALPYFRSIPTGIDPSRVQASDDEILAFRKQWGLKESDFVIGTACFMRSWKGIDDFLEAADRLRGIVRLKWMVIGGGHSERFIQRAKELQLDSIVQFTGHLERPFPAIGALNVFALLSTANEGVSQAILQAAFLGKPLIATATGGLGEICLDGETGFQVPPFAPSAVAARITELYENHTLGERFGKAAHALVLRKFTLQHMLNLTEEIYAQIC